jgi:hypothetical protein
MNELAEICGMPASAVGSLDLTSLRDGCFSFTQALALPGGELALVIVSGLLGAGAVLWHRLAKSEPTAATVGTTIEGGLYAAIGAWAGSAGGLLFAELAPPGFLGALFGVVAGVGALFAILALIRGDGEAGWKLLGVALFAALIIPLVVLMFAAFNVPGEGPAGEAYAGYLNSVALVAGSFGAINGALVALYRGATLPLGWLLVAVNSSWGALGNALGLMTHAASFCCYADHGRFHKPSDRRFYVCYENGFSLKKNASGHPFAFTEGAVMTADTDELRTHEGVHAIQHYLWGPIYLLSHFGWFIPWAGVALFAGPARGVSIGEAVTRLSYYNNPWEVFAYSFGGHRDPNEELIFGAPLAGILAAGWIVLATGLFATLIILRVT